jgi:hypothetical protein
MIKQVIENLNQSVPGIRQCSIRHSITPMYVFVPWQRSSEYDTLLVLLFKPVVFSGNGQ